MEGKPILMGEKNVNRIEQRTRLHLRQNGLGSWRSGILPPHKPVLPKGISRRRPAGQINLSTFRVSLRGEGTSWLHSFAYDEVMIRNLLTILLQDEGYFVLSAPDGQEALELSRAYPGAIDLLVTDVKMPRLTCIDLCSCLLEERPGIKVVVMLGTDMNGIVSPGVDSPLLPKPFDGEILKAKIRAILAAPPRPAPDVHMVFLCRPLWSGTRSCCPRRSRSPCRLPFWDRLPAFNGGSEVNVAVS